MKLVKVGTAYLNMDLVTDIWVDREQVTVFFAVPSMYSVAPFHGVTNAISTREIVFRGARAKALIEWLWTRTEDITPDGEEAEATGAPEEDDSLTSMDLETVDDGPSS